MAHTRACCDVSESQTSASSSILDFCFLLNDRSTLPRRNLSDCFRHLTRFRSLLLLVAERTEPFAKSLEVGVIGLIK